jgi:cytochrome c-type biogenesis protein CcmI
MNVVIPAIFLALAAVFFVLYPILAGREASLEQDDQELTDAQHRKNQALMALRDVEYDFHAGKLDREDYVNLKREISAEALQAIDEEEAEWLAREAAKEFGGALRVPDDVEAEIAALRTSIREGVVCPQCAHPNPRGSKFCGDCGAALPTTTGAVGG